MKRGRNITKETLMMILLLSGSLATPVFAEGRAATGLTGVSGIIPTGTIGMNRIKPITNTGMLMARPINGGT